MLHLLTITLANQALTERETAGFYYGTLVYQNMFAHGSGKYGEGLPTVSSSTFHEYAILV